MKNDWIVSFMSSSGIRFGWKPRSEKREMREVGKINKKHAEMHLKQAGFEQRGQRRVCCRVSKQM